MSRLHNRLDRLEREYERVMAKPIAELTDSELDFRIELVNARIEALERDRHCRGDGASAPNE